MFNEERDPYSLVSRKINHIIGVLADREFTEPVENFELQKFNKLQKGFKLYSNAKEISQFY
jgi:hypothetical protein